MPEQAKFYHFVILNVSVSGLYIVFEIMERSYFFKKIWVILIFLWHI